MASLGKSAFLGALFLIILSFVHINLALDLPVTEINVDIDVKPGGVVHDHEEKVGDFTCKFTYAAQGGTNEKWAMSISKSADNLERLCTVQRPSGTSYLFFQQFKLEISGAKLSDVAVYGNSFADLNSDEYVADKTANSVTQVDGKFNSQLAKVQVYSNKGKSEL